MSTVRIVKRVLWPASIMMVLTRIRFFRPFCSQFSTEGAKIVIQLQQGLVQQATCEGSIQASRGLYFFFFPFLYLLFFMVFQTIISLWCSRQSFLCGVPDNHFFVVFQTIISLWCSRQSFLCGVPDNHFFVVFQTIISL